MRTAPVSPTMPRKANDNAADDWRGADRVWMLPSIARAEDQTTGEVERHFFSQLPEGSGIDVVLNYDLALSDALMSGVALVAWWVRATTERFTTGGLRSAGIDSTVVEPEGLSPGPGSFFIPSKRYEDLVSIHSPAATSAMLGVGYSLPAAAYKPTERQPQPSRSRAAPMVAEPVELETRVFADVTPPVVARAPMKIVSQTRAKFSGLVREVHE